MMAVSLRVLDDGAWISVDDERRVSTSEVWPLHTTGDCDCETSYFLLEAFYHVRLDATDHVVTAGVVGQCIDCGRELSFDRFPVGRLVDGAFHQFDAGGTTVLREPTR